MQDVSTYSKNTHPDDPGINAQTHVHEFLGSTQIDILHNHRFAGVTSEAIPLKGGGHIHGIFTNTDFTRNHLHELAVETGPAIPVGKGRHVHLVKASTTVDLDHFHNTVFATLIDDPIAEY